MASTVTRLRRWPGLALLSVRPLRRRTLAALQLGKHILIDGDDVRINVPATLMKGKKQPYHADWPGALRAELFCYIDTIRPILLAGERVDNSFAGDALWVSERGTMLTADAIYRRVRHLTQQATGQAINLHRFRNIAASTIAINEPEQIDIAQDVLGHSDPRSKEFYIQANQLVAVRRSHRVEDEILRIAGKKERY
jgi:integrase/recombinase XerD